MAAAIKRARALGTETEYQASDILKDDKLREMKDCLLVQIDDDDVVLRPVRRKDAPHFRGVGSGYDTRIDRGENDPTHNACINELYKAFEGRTVNISTYFFPDASEGSDATPEREHQLIARLKAAPDYKWWKESRVSIGLGEYIQPGLMGRDKSVFMSKADSRGIVIEVIQTHFPDEKTFFSLLQISALGFLVVFYFIPPDEMNSKYNRFRINENSVDLHITYYLLDGIVWANAKERERYNYTNAQWYDYLKRNYFATPMDKKNKKPNNKRSTDRKTHPE
jgi:hypothetical protein